MAECRCGSRAVILPARCEKHFFKDFERRVFRSLDSFGIPAGARVAVACSGGKDSLTTLHLLLEWGRVSVEAIAVHEGIAGYRDRTLSHLRAHCEALGVPLRVVSFAQRGVQFSALLTHAARANGSVCSSCGVLRRSLLNEASHGCDYLATGHNLDDEAQSVVMNLVKANRPLLPRGKREGFVPRIKPLRLCSEREVALYALLKGLRPDFEECPHAGKAYRSTVRSWLNQMERLAPGTKRKLVKMAWPAASGGEMRRCSCGQPSRGDRCAACLTVAALENPGESAATRGISALPARQRGKRAATRPMMLSTTPVAKAI